MYVGSSSTMYEKLLFVSPFLRKGNNLVAHVVSPLKIQYSGFPNFY